MHNFFIVNHKQKIETTPVHVHTSATVDPIAVETCTVDSSICI